MSKDEATAKAWSRVVAAISSGEPHQCFCVGPDPGETKCPCELAAERVKQWQEAKLHELFPGIEVSGAEK